jgi:hypothetical protein
MKPKVAHRLAIAGLTLILATGMNSIGTQAVSAAPSPAGPAATARPFWLTAGQASEPAPATTHSLAPLTAALPPATPAQVVARAKTWLTGRNGGPVPYSMYVCFPSGGSAPCTVPNYRTDCSGYVSMALGLSSSLVTGELAQSSVSTPISKDQLQQADMLINPGTGSAGHVVLFDHWAVADHSSYWGYEQSGDGGTHYRQIPYPYYNGYPMSPYRYNNIRRSSSMSGDGKADIAWYENWNNGKMSLLQTNSTGTGVGSSSAFFTGVGNPDWAGAGDFDGDGKTDIAWYENWNNGTIKIFYSNGTGIRDAQTWTSGFGKPTWATVGDFNGDGKADIAWYENWNNGKMSLLLTNSTGTGVASTSAFFTGVGNPDWAGAGDFDGDGKTDIAWYENWNNGTIKIFYSNGTSIREARTWQPGIGKPDFATIGDFNGDGKADIAWYENWNNGQMGLLLTNSTGTGPAGFPTFFSGVGKPDWAGAGDFDGDGKTDIAWYENWNNGTIKVFYSNGTSIRDAQTWISGFGKPTWATVA